METFANVLLAAADAPGMAAWLRVGLIVLALAALGAAWDEFTRPPKQGGGGWSATEIKSWRPILGMLALACGCGALLVSGWLLVPAVVLGLIAANG